MYCTYSVVLQTVLVEMDDVGADSVHEILGMRHQHENSIVSVSGGWTHNEYTCIHIR